jgi:hypothetical protein
MVVAAVVPAVSYCIMYMWHAIDSMCYVSMLVRVEYRLSFLFLLGIQFLCLHQHH